jgi:hypothetical protein
MREFLRKIFLTPTNKTVNETEKQLIIYASQRSALIPARRTRPMMAFTVKKA